MELYRRVNKIEFEVSSGYFTRWSVSVWSNDLEIGLESLCLLSNETVTVDLSRSKSFSRKCRNLKRVADVFPVLSIQGTCIFDSRDFTHLLKWIRKLCPSIWSVYWTHERSSEFESLDSDDDLTKLFMLQFDFSFCLDVYKAVHANSGLFTLNPTRFDD